MPEPTEHGSEPKKFSRSRTPPMQCRTEIIVIRVQRGERCCFVLDPLCVGAFSDAKVMRKMSLPCVFLFSSFSETFGAILPQGFEEAITQALLTWLLYGNQ